MENGDRAKLESDIKSLTDEQKTDLDRIILSNSFFDIDYKTNDQSLINILKLYAATKMLISTIYTEVVPEIWTGC